MAPSSTAIQLLGRDPSTCRLVLATDLDGTFLGGDRDQRGALYDRIDRCRDEMILVYVTGRDLDFIAELVADPFVPSPDFVIGDVGTTVVHVPDFVPLAPVQDWIDERWGASNEVVRDLLDGVAWLELQPVMGDRRVSYYYDPAALDPEVVGRVEAAGFDVVTSADVFFDVLPRGVAKGPTLVRVVDALGLPHDRVLVAGDTMNDLSLFHTGLRGVAVGNSERRLVEAVTGLEHVHLSDQPGCAGIADAIDVFGFFD